MSNRDLFTLGDLQMGSPNFGDEYGNVEWQFPSSNNEPKGKQRQQRKSSRKSAGQQQYPAVQLPPSNFSPLGLEQFEGIELQAPGSINYGPSGSPGGGPSGSPSGGPSGSPSGSPSGGPSGCFTVANVLDRFRPSGHRVYNVRWIRFRRVYYDYVLVGYPTKHTRNNSNKSPGNKSKKYLDPKRSEVMSYIRDSSCMKLMLAETPSNGDGKPRRPGNPRSALKFQRVLLDSFAGDPWKRFVGKEGRCVSWPNLNRMELLFYLLFLFDCDPFDGNERTNFKSPFGQNSLPVRRPSRKRTLTTRSTRRRNTNTQQQIGVHKNASPTHKRASGKSRVKRTLSMRQQ